MKSMAYEPKPQNNPHLSAAIQRARDNLVCTCGHSNMSHAYGDEDHAWPGGSRIGTGPCGHCPCSAFADAART